MVSKERRQPIPNILLYCKYTNVLKSIKSRLVKCFERVKIAILLATFSVNKSNHYNTHHTIYSICKSPPNESYALRKGNVNSCIQILLATHLNRKVIILFQKKIQFSWISCSKLFRIRMHRFMSYRFSCGAIQQYIILNSFL